MKAMTKTKLIALALAPAAMLAFTGCKTHTEPSPFAKSSKTSTEEGVPGGVVVENSYDLTARVTAIDPVRRTVTVVGASGDSTTFLCGSAVRNFNQIHVGDQLKIRLTDLLSGALVDPKNPSRDGGSVVHQKIGKAGTQPGRTGS